MNTRYGTGAHAEGKDCLAYGDYSHAEGENTDASGDYSHAEGYHTGVRLVSISGSGTPTAAHAEGYQAIAANRAAHAEGESTRAIGAYSHAEGYATQASGSGAHAEGKNTRTKGNYSHAEGENTMAYGAYSHAGGYSTNSVDIATLESLSSKYGDVVTNWNTTPYALAYGNASFVGGQDCLAWGATSTALGFKNVAYTYQLVCGKYNKLNQPTSTEVPGLEAGMIFCVGNGSSSGNRSNAFEVFENGNCNTTGTWKTNGADYAEYFEWLDGNYDNEDRRGYFVTLDGNQIRKANAEDDYILGITSAAPAITGNSYMSDWHDKYLRDIFGSKLTETVEIPETTDETTGEVIPAHTETHFILNPEYKPDQEYICRDQRPEWTPVGTHGQLVVVDDGTCEVNGFCKVADGGIATKSDEQTPYRVIERLDDSHIRVFLK